MGQPVEYEYDDADIQAMCEFLAHGAWIVPMGSKYDSKTIRSVWKDGGVSAEDIGKWIAKDRHVGFAVILNTCHMVLVDLDCPLPLVQAEFEATGMPLADRTIWIKRKKDEFKAMPYEQRLEYLRAYWQHGEKGPGHRFELSASGYGMHWFYRCPNPANHFAPSPTFEIYGNKKPALVQNWAGLAGWYDMRPVPLNDILDHWEPVEKLTNQLKMPKKRVEPVDFSDMESIRNFDYEGYLSRNYEAQVGRNNRLFHWALRAAINGDAGAVDEARNWALNAGLTKTEITATVNSAVSKGKSVAAPPEIMEKRAML